MFAIDKTKYLPYLCGVKQKVNIMMLSYMMKMIIL